MREENLSSWIDYGTLLGAYRQGDILPWDQDADVGYLQRDVGRVKFNVIPKLQKRYGVIMKHYNPVTLRYNQTQVDVFAMGTYSELKLNKPASASNTTLTRYAQPGRDCGIEGRGIRGGRDEERDYTSFKSKTAPLCRGKNKVVFRATFRSSAWMEARYSDMEWEWLWPLRRCRLGNLSLSCPSDTAAVLCKRYPHSIWLPISVPFKLHCYTNPISLFRVLFSNSFQSS